SRSRAHALRPARQALRGTGRAVGLTLQAGRHRGARLSGLHRRRHRRAAAAAVALAEQDQPGAGDPRRHQRQRDGAAARHQRGAHVDDHLRAGGGAGRLRRRDHGAPGGGSAGDGRSHPDRVLHRDRRGRHGQLHRRRRGRTADRRDAGPDRHALRRARRRDHLHRHGRRAPAAPAGAVRTGGDVGGVKGILLAVLLLATAPLYADYTPFYLGLLTEVLVFGLFALAFDVMLGHAGVMSLGHSAFLGVAAYTTGLLLARFRAPVEVSLVAGAVGGLLTALVVGALVLRKRGVYLAMLTLAMSQVFYYAALMWTPVTGGTDGLGNLPVLYLSEP